MTEPVKVLPMAKLLRMAREKEERARAEEAAAKDATSEQNIASADPHFFKDNSNTNAPSTNSPEGIVQQTILRESIVPQNTTENLLSPLPNVQSNISEHDSETPSLTINENNLHKKFKHSNQKALKATGSISHETIPNTSIVSQNIVNEKKGYYPIFNDISDRLIPELVLDPYQQAVLHRLYRLSRGWKSEECEVGMGTLAKQCVMSRSQVQRSLSKLAEKGLIENLGAIKQGGREGNRYKVLPGLAKPSQTIPPQTIVEETIVHEERTIPSENTVVPQTIVSESNNKNKNKDFKNNTHKEGVGAKSKFSLEECRAYAEHLNATGQGINNPGGYALSIYKSGVADDLLEKFVTTQKEREESDDARRCPDCGGTGMYYPEGYAKGAAKCRHVNLA